MMRKKIYAYTLAAAAAAGAALCSCSADGGENFSNVVVIPDENDSSLPKATEIGSNTAGAYFDVRFPSFSNRLLWTMNFPSAGGGQAAEIIEFKLTDTDWAIKNYLRFAILGQMKNASLELIPLQFTFLNPPVDSLTGLLALSNRTFRTADGTLNAAAIISSWNGISFTNYNPIIVTDAALSFTSCKQIYQDQQFYGVSVSGRFTMRGTATDTISVAVDNGRFDLLFTTRDEYGVFR